MVHAYLITGGDDKIRILKAQEIANDILGETTDFSIKQPDIIVIDEPDSIKISQVRDLKKKLQLKPYSLTYKIAILKNADQLTLPAQNALLKTLEEPPENSIIILTAPKEDLLLKTILSRCQIVKLPVKVGEFFFDETELKASLQETLKIIKANSGKRLVFAEGFSGNREKALDFLNLQLFTWRKIIHRRFLEEEKAEKRQLLSPDEIIRTTRNIQQAKEMIDQQANHKLVIENLLLSYPEG